MSRPECAFCKRPGYRIGRSAVCPHCATRSEVGYDNEQPTGMYLIGGATSGRAYLGDVSLGDDPRDERAKLRGLLADICGRDD